jgi:putative transferase (TIGR04331 family)
LIIIGDKKLVKFRGSAKEYYSDLYNEGVLHFDYKSAAIYINNISDNIDEWWGSPSLQNAVQRFKKNYIHTNDKCIDSWVNFFK